jgi:hypothetical protein
MKVALTFLALFSLAIAEITQISASSQLVSQTSTSNTTLTILNSTI